MENTSLYHDGMRQLQDVRETRSLADRLEQVTVRSEFTEEDRLFIEGSSMVFVATADTHGHPDCSYKGGLPGFVRVLDKCTLAFPDYDYWAYIAAATSSSSATACFIPISDQRRTARILKYLTPARVLYLLTSRASLWPYGQTTSQSTRPSRNSGLCSIKPKIKEYSDKMMIEWLVSADFLRKMKRVHIYFTPLITSAASSIAYSGASASVSVSVYDTDECDE